VVQNAVFKRVTILCGMCYGRCPAYSVTIWGDGKVVYKGKNFVLKTGR
jgi:hypothetical protein